MFVTEHARFLLSTLDWWGTLGTAWVASSHFHITSSLSTEITVVITVKALSQVVSSVKTLHVIHSGMLSVDELNTGCSSGHGQCARGLHDAGLISCIGVDLRRHDGGVLLWHRCAHHHVVHHAAAVTILININDVVTYTQLMQTWSHWVPACCNSISACHVTSQLMQTIS